MTTATRGGYAESGWGQVHYRCAGSDGPALVLLHESPQSSWVFERALPLLGERLRVFALDTPGYGLSAPPPADVYEIPDYAEALMAAVDDLGLDTFAVGGVHTGASLAIDLAARLAPDRVTAVVLSGVPVFPEEEAAQMLGGWSPPLELDDDGDHLRWAWERYVRIWGPDSGPDMLTRAAVGLLSVAARYEWAYNAAFRFDPEQELRSLRVPVLLINAADDLLAHLDERALSMLADGRLEVHPGLRGQVAWRAPEWFARTVGDFVLGADRVGSAEVQGGPR